MNARGSWVGVCSGGDNSDHKCSKSPPRKFGGRGVNRKWQRGRQEEEKEIENTGPFCYSFFITFMMQLTSVYLRETKNNGLHQRHCGVL